MDNKSVITLTLFSVAVSMWLAAWVLSVFDALWAVFGVFVLAVIFAGVYGYPTIKKQIKNKISSPNPKNIMIVNDPSSNLLSLCNYESRVPEIFIKKIEIGTSERWLIVKSFPLTKNETHNLHNGRCESIEFVKTNDTLGFYTLAETHANDAIEFQQFKDDTRSFDVHVGFRFSKTGADQDRFWKVIVDFRDGNIHISIEDIR